MFVPGHNEKLLTKAIKFQNKKPISIIAKTIKGKGVPFMEKSPAEWHHKKIDIETLNKIKIINEKTI